MDFEAEGIFDAPQDIPDGVSGASEDIYESKTPDKIEVSEENGGTHTMAECMEEWYEAPRAKTDNSGPKRVYRVYGKAGSRKLFESFAEFQESLEANAEDASERLVEIESGKE